MPKTADPRTGSRSPESSAVQSKRPGNAIQGYPTPNELATPTDLSPEQVRAVVEAVNPLIADAFSLFVKAKNFHWHVSGPHFRDYHLLLDEHAQSVLASIEPLAERLRRIGGATIRSISHIAQLQSIPDNNDDFVPPGHMIQELISDNRHIAESQRAAIDVCEENRDTPTANILQDLLDQTEKRIWFLYEISAGSE